MLDGFASVDALMEDAGGFVGGEGEEDGAEGEREGEGERGGEGVVKIEGEE